MPTLTDQLLDEENHVVAKSLSGFRVAVAETFWTAVARMEAFRSEVQTSLKYICGIIMFFGFLLILLTLGAVPATWKASALNSDVMRQSQELYDVRVEVKKQGVRLQKLEGRMDRIQGRIDEIGKQLEVLIRRGETKSGG